MDNTVKKERLIQILNDIKIDKVSYVKGLGYDLTRKCGSRFYCIDSHNQDLEQDKLFPPKNNIMLLFNTSDQIITNKQYDELALILREYKGDNECIELRTKHVESITHEYFIIQVFMTKGCELYQDLMSNNILDNDLY